MSALQTALHRHCQRRDADLIEAAGIDNRASAI